MIQERLREWGVALVPIGKGDCPWVTGKVDTELCICGRLAKLRFCEALRSRGAPARLHGFVRNVQIVFSAAVKKQHETMQQMKKKSAPQKEAARLAKEAARRACTNGRLEFSMVQLLTPMDVNGKLSDLGYRTLNPHIDFNRCRKEHRLEKIKMLEQHITDNGLV